MPGKALIFDLDGTLLDTLEDLAAATNYALRKNNFPARTLDEVRMFVGNGIRKLIERAVPPRTSVEEQERAYADFNIYYKEHCADRTCAYPGVTELLRSARAQGWRTAIVSNKADYGVQELARQYFPGLLDAACGEKEGVARKPAPDMVFAALRELGLGAEDAIYIGDSDTDLLTAANAGVPCVGACWGFRGREFLEAHGAEYLAERAQDVLALCEEISREMNGGGA